MPEWLIPIATQFGVAGAFYSLAALWLLHRGAWFPASTVADLKATLTQKEQELHDERLQHREDVEIWEKRTFSALSVSEKLTNITAERTARTKGQSQGAA